MEEALLTAAAEPILRADDLEVWDAWRRAAGVHARTGRHRAAVDRACRIVEAALRVAPRSAIMLSGGKDSSVLSHLLHVRMGVGLPTFSEKDDLDYPGEEAHVRGLAAAWGLDLRILRPPTSPRQWIEEHRHELEPGDDWHGRAAGLSKACFYGVVEAATADYDGVFLGLRQDESRARALDRATHHATIDGRRALGLYQYQRGPRAGRWKATPIGHWSGLDVMAYAEANGVDLLPLYQAIAFMHRNEPWRVRKSWWIPGASVRHGGAAWLGHYFPSLHAQLRRWFPLAVDL